MFASNRHMLWPTLLAALLGGDPAPAHESADSSAAPAEPKAITLNVNLKGDLVSNVAGGIKRGTTGLTNLDLKATFDAEKLLKWKGATFFAHTISDLGGKPNAKYVGSLQGVDNIEVETNTTKLYQAWLEQAALDGKFSARLGLYDLNSEFYVTESSGLFLHPAPGIGSELAQTGQNGPSIFPTTSLGLRLRLQPARALYAQAVLLDGVPGDPNNPRGTHVQFNRGDGSLIAVEAGYLPGRGAEEKDDSPGPGKIALGAWRYTAKFDDLIDVDDAGEPVQRANNSGAYVIAEKRLYTPEGDSARGLDGFARVGFANSDVNRLAHYVQVGAVYTGLLRGRAEDQIGLSVAVATNGSKYRDLLARDGVTSTRNEIGCELTYRAPINAWLTVQPGLQYVIHPDSNPEIDNALVALVRFEANWEW